MRGIRRGMRALLPAASIHGTPAGNVRAATPLSFATLGGSRKRATRLLHLSGAVLRAACVVMRTATRADALGNDSSHALSRTSPRKSLTLLGHGSRGGRKTQVLLPPRMPKVKQDHLCCQLGMEQATGMAPPTRYGSGWSPPPHLSLTNYGCSASRSYAPGTQNADYVGVEEAAGLLTRAECHMNEIAYR